MARSTLNLGILAHVDAGKTTLTERLLHAAGVLDEIGSVDAGTTQTDSLALERQRGITIRSAVVSFVVEGVTVNLVDTPGHPDFIAEVERALGILDGAVLVVSAVEGVQPQTRVLMRALQRLEVPTLLMVNKVDRGGADCDRVLRAICRRLTPAAVPMGAVRGVGTRAAEVTPYGAGDDAFRDRLVDVLSGQDESLLADYVGGADVLPHRRLREALASQTRQAQVHPVFFGSAVTGAGVEPLMAGLVELLPVAPGDAAGPVSGRVFKIERGASGEKVTYVRMFTGTVHARDRVSVGSHLREKVTAVSVFDDGAWVRRALLSAGGIGRLWGLGPAQVGDLVGEPEVGATDRRQTAQFPPPMLESVVVPQHPEHRGSLRVALAQLAEQDPLIKVAQDDAREEISVRLYGEVQKEVVQATLDGDFGIQVTFRDTTTICVERPKRSGLAVEIVNSPTNPFRATIGLRVDPAAPGSGTFFRLEVDARTVPMYVYRTIGGFSQSMGQYVHDALAEGLHGWQVTDCVVTMNRCGYTSADGPPSTRGPLSTAADFRKLTPMVLMRALAKAGTAVCEPTVRAGLEVPSGSTGAVLGVMARLGAVVETQALQDELCTLTAVLPAARVQDLARRLPGLTAGEGVLESSFAGYQPVGGRSVPTRRRTTPDPLNREQYLMHPALVGLSGG